MEGTISYRTKVRDIVTGYTGEVTAVGYYFERKPRMFLVESIDNTGRPIECWVEEHRIELIEGS